MEAAGVFCLDFLFVEGFGIVGSKPIGTSEGNDRGNPEMSSDVG